MEEMGMSLSMIIVIGALVVWYFGTALSATGEVASNIITKSADMAQTQMNVYVASHKASAIDAMAKVDIDTDKVTKAQANMAALNSINL